MKKVICLMVALIACSGCAMLPQMQNWDTKDKWLGGLFIAECVWDGIETSKFINKKDRHISITTPDGVTTTRIKHAQRENNPFVKNKTSAAVFGIAGLYTVLKVADILPEVRTGWLITFDILEWGGAEPSHRILRKW